jgi:hypothetical protein
VVYHPGVVVQHHRPLIAVQIEELAVACHVRR